MARLKRQAAQRLKQLESQVAVDRRCRELIASEASLADRWAIVLSIPGIGEATAIALLADMPELGELASKQAASLAGLAPVARESGTGARASSAAAAPPAPGALPARAGCHALQRTSASQIPGADCRR